MYKQMEPLLTTPMLNSTSAGLHWLAQTHSVLVFYHKNRRISTMECTLIFGFGSYPPKFIYEIPSKFRLRFPPIFVPCATKFPSFISLRHKISESESIKMSDDSDSDSDFGFGSLSPLLDDDEPSTTAQESVVDDGCGRKQQQQEDIEAVIVREEDKDNEKQKEKDDIQALNEEKEQENEHSTTTQELVVDDEHEAVVIGDDGMDNEEHNI